MLDNLNNRLNQLCGEVSWDAGYVMESCDGNCKIQKNENMQFSSASVIKLNILWSVYKKISEESLKQQDSVIIREADITGGSGVLQYLKPGLALAVRDLCALMIDFSDNTATNILIDMLGMDLINSDINKCGLQKTALRRKMMDFKARESGLDNLTTPEDVQQILKLIDTSGEIKKHLRDDMLSILFNQECKGNLPQYMPAKFKFGHKSGGLDDVLHDAGILITESGQRFYLTVMTGGFPALETGKQFINSLGLEIFKNIF